MTRNRDVSGFSKGAVGEGPDRSPGIAPPRKRQAQPAPQVPAPLAAVPEPTRAALPAPNSTPTEPAAQQPTAAPQPQPESPAPVVPVPSGSGSGSVKTGFSLTARQLSWFQKRAERNDQWLGDLMAELLETFEDELRRRPVERVAKKRRGSNFTQIQVYLEPHERERLDGIVGDTGRSMAATGRLVVDLAMTAE